MRSTAPHGGFKPLMGQYDKESKPIEARTWSELLCIITALLITLA